VLTFWDSFYVIVGSSAGALTGLQFVVIVLGAEMNVGGLPATRAFGTPTVVHFCMTLLVSAILSAPWPSLAGPALAVACCGAGGLVYGIVVVNRARTQTIYKPVFEDWLWHGGLPTLAYATLLAAGIELTRHPAPALFGIGGAALMLLFVGIHNAWDAVIYIALSGNQKEG
jgi:hypothetical protein